MIKGKAKRFSVRKFSFGQYFEIERSTYQRDDPSKSSGPEKRNTKKIILICVVYLQLVFEQCQFLNTTVKSYDMFRILKLY